MSATEKVMGVLEEVCRSGGPYRLGDISSGSGVGKSSTHRILKELVEANFVMTEGPGSYSVGPRMTALASGALDETQRKATLSSVLVDLQQAVQHTVHFAMRSGTEAVYVQKIESAHPFQMVSRVGMQIPLHCTAIGKCILAWMSDDDLDAYLVGVHLERRTANTLIEPEALRAELRKIREQGFSIDDMENESTTRCVGAPVFDANGDVIGGVSVSVIIFLLSTEGLTILAPLVIEAGRQLSRILASPRPSGSW